MMYKLICTVGHCEIERARLYASHEAAVADGEEWMEWQSADTEAEIERGNYVAAEIPFFYTIEPFTDGA